MEFLKNILKKIADFIDWAMSKKDVGKDNFLL